MLLYEMIYPEIAHLQEPVFDLDGVQWGGPGRDGDNAPAQVDVWKAWQKTYQRQHREDFTKIPRYVSEYFQNSKQYLRPPTQKELDFVLLMNTYGISIDWDPVKEKESKEKPFTWSGSALNSFESCPFAFAEERIYKRVKKVYSAASSWGIRLHELLAGYLEKGNITDEVKPYLIYAQSIKACPVDDLLVEQKYAITRDFKFVDWFSKDVWGRGVLDVGLVRGDWCKVLDWKTGKRRLDFTELEIFLHFIAIKYPHIKKFDAAYLFLKEQNPANVVANISDSPLTRQEVMDRWGGINKRISRMEEAVKCKVFPKKTSGLCFGWCACMDCEHWKEPR